MHMYMYLHSSIEALCEYVYMYMYMQVVQLFMWTSIQMHTELTHHVPNINLLFL